MLFFVFAFTKIAGFFFLFFFSVNMRWIFIFYISMQTLKETIDIKCFNLKSFRSSIVYFFVFLLLEYKKGGLDFAWLIKELRVVHNFIHRYISCISVIVLWYISSDRSFIMNCHECKKKFKIKTYTCTCSSWSVMLKGCFFSLLFF